MQYNHSIRDNHKPIMKNLYQHFCGRGYQSNDVSGEPHRHRIDLQKIITLKTGFSINRFLIPLSI
jgi:hypothetical protein